MNTTLQSPKKAKTGILVAGAIAGVSLVLLNSTARNKVVDTSKSVKDSVNKYASSVKEDPSGAKDAIITRIKNATEISKEAVTKIQSILDDQVSDIKSTTKNITEDTKDVLSSAKEAKGDITDVKDKAVEVKDELLSTKDDLDNGSSGGSNGKTETDHSITNKPVN